MRRTRLPGERGELHELPDEGRREVVDAEVAQVFEGVDGLAAAGARHAGDEHQVTSAGPGSGLLNADLVAHGSPLG
jgi:hypothetical protein